MSPILEPETLLDMDESEEYEEEGGAMIRQLSSLERVIGEIDSDETSAGLLPSLTEKFAPRAAVMLGIHTKKGSEICVKCWVREGSAPPFCGITSSV